MPEPEVAACCMVPTKKQRSGAQTSRPFLWCPMVPPLPMKDLVPKPSQTAPSAGKTNMFTLMSLQDFSLQTINNDRHFKLLNVVYSAAMCNQNIHAGRCLERRQRLLNPVTFFQPEILSVWICICLHPASTLLC